MPADSKWTQTHPDGSTPLSVLVQSRVAETQTEFETLLDTSAWLDVMTGEIFRDMDASVDMVSVIVRMVCTCASDFNRRFVKPL
eukprot:660506-Alexandrium_andersonii.AAC.1